MDGLGVGRLGEGVGGKGIGFMNAVKAVRAVTCMGLGVGNARRVDVRLPGKGNSNSRGARLVHLIITMINWIRTRRLSIKNSVCGWAGDAPRDHEHNHIRQRSPPQPYTPNPATAIFNP